MARKTHIADLQRQWEKRPLARTAMKRAGTQWIHHNHQETGNPQNIAPIFCANQGQVFFDPDFIKFDSGGRGS